MRATGVLYEGYARGLGLDLGEPDCLSNKVKVCSFLVCCGASIELESYPSSSRDFRTGNSGLQLSVGDPSLRALIPFFYMEDSNPITVRGSYVTGRAVIEYDGRELFEVDILPDVETGNGNINLEFDTLIAAIPDEPYGTRGCHYHNMGKPCAFCVLGSKEVGLGPADLVAAYGKVGERLGREPQVLLTGGTGPAGDRGLSKYVPYVRELRGSFGEARIAIEAAPPREVSCLDTLIDLGMDTFAANLEFFSGETRDSLLPGKSAIQLDEYERVLTYCNDNGVRTFSALIAGPEDEAGTLEGVEFLAKIGVPTNLICLRPFPGAGLEDHPRVDPAWFLRVTAKAVEIMGRHGVMEDLSNTAGCGSCGACAMEMNLHRLQGSDAGRAVVGTLG